jgi:hypothetical protein
METIALSIAQGVSELLPPDPSGGIRTYIRYVDDQLVDEIWKDLGGRVERARVDAVAREVEREFGDARVTTFIPIFIRRLTRERLTVEMREES